MGLNDYGVKAQEYIDKYMVGHRVFSYPQLMRFFRYNCGWVRNTPALPEAFTTIKYAFRTIDSIARNIHELMTTTGKLTPDEYEKILDAIHDDLTNVTSGYPNPNDRQTGETIRTIITKRSTT